MAVSEGEKWQAKRTADEGEDDEGTGSFAIVVEVPT